jgi:hypothetical protein
VPIVPFYCFTMPPKATTAPSATAPKALETDTKQPVLDEKTPQIVPNAPEVAPNPVPATERDTPVLIQYSAPDPANAPVPAAPVAPAAPDASRAQALESVKEVVGAALDAVATATEPTHTGATTRIKVLRSHPKLGAFTGETTTINAALAKELVEGGFAVKVSADGEAEAMTPTEGQFKAAEAAYERFKAVAQTADGVSLMPAFAEAPHEIRCAFVAAVDPAYNHKAE